jgi:hypothetical protein
MGRDG